MQRAWRRITPSSRALNRSSFATSGRYGQTCADESRSHIAGISPVTTVVSGLPSNVEKCTVVSSVFGKQFVKSAASSGSPICTRVSCKNCSTAAERNRRSPGAGRCPTNAEDGSSEKRRGVRSSGSRRATRLCCSRVLRDSFRTGPGLKDGFIALSSLAHASSHSLQWIHFYIAGECRLYVEIHNHSEK